MSTDDLPTDNPAGAAAPAVPSLIEQLEQPEQATSPQAAPDAGGIFQDARLGRLPIEALADVELKVEVILGRARLRLQELLDVRPGQAIELDRARNSPVDILVNGTLFARGDIVVIDDTNLGVRVSEVVGFDAVKEGHA